jgi:aspartyl-tRNA(Asn)/glutamyl-tRNA(Gln) amidotransferase subunit A
MSVAARARKALDLPVLECAREMRAEKLSPVALAEAALERIERLAPGLGCFVTVTPDRALRDAHAAEADLDAGRDRGPLHGIPFGLKDNVDTAGIRTTWGTDLYADRVPERDATVARRLHAAGAVLIGKLAMTELALGGSSAASSISGACRNPWDPARWAGGSSSGPAAAVAARLVGFSIGTDTTGSLLGPAALCGVAAHRPTFGAVPRAGVLPYAYSLDKVGVMARTAADCAAVLGVIGGRDRADPSSVDIRLAFGAGHHHARGLKVAVLDPVPGEADTVELKGLFKDALDELARAGFELERTALPDLAWIEVMRVILDAEAEVAFDELISSGRIAGLRDPDYRGKPWPTLEGRPSDYVRAQTVRAELQKFVAEFFRGFAFVVSPVSSVAPLVAEPIRLKGGDRMNVIGNLLGLPSVSVPMGFLGPGRMPASFTITGPAMEDGLVLAAAERYQKHTAWHHERPPLLRES